MKRIQIYNLKPETWIFFQGKLLYFKEKTKNAMSICYHRKIPVMLYPWDVVTVAAVSDKVTTEGWV
jgi:hypothetical protein